ncbi:MAG TPA: ABC transporter substrate-binding protein [Candidatus Saccharimonadales bacterium]|nr:ABC transporter substrate-binding protein [Candidatus Saccharimonadales bacterium]
MPNDQPQQTTNAQNGVSDQPQLQHQDTPLNTTGGTGSSKRKLNLTVLIIILTVLVIGGPGLYILLHHVAKKAPAATKLTKVTMNMGWLHQAQFAGFYVAKEKGFYKDAGLDVELLGYKDGVDLNKEVAGGKVDFATTTPLEVIAARDSGYKVKAIAAIYQTSPYAFVSPKASNIKTPADLKGKTLGYVGGNTQAKISYPSLLSSYGISLSQVTVKDTDFDIVKSFQEHEADTADIYRTDQTYLLDKAGIEYNILLPEQFGFGLYGDVVVASDSIVKNRPDVTSKFTKATLKGLQYALNHEDEALAMTAKYEDPLYKDPAYEKHIFQNSVPLIKPTGNQPLGNMEFVPWNRAYQAIQSAGQLKTGFNVSDAYTTEFLK